MSKVLIFGGTSEGRILSQRLSDAKIYCDVCVATEYGKALLSAGDCSDYVNIIEGRLSEQKMLGLFQKEHYSVIVDATHPYAQEVSVNIQKSVSSYNAAAETEEGTKHKLTLLKLNRASDFKTNDKKIRYFENSSDCARFLSAEFSDKNILLTTGSKELSYFCGDEALKKRLIVRVIPSIESLEICKKAGLEGRQIIAMQGPFSKQLNLAIIADNNIGVLVTKESGDLGGFEEKISAAGEAGINCYVIKRPDSSRSDHIPRRLRRNKGVCAVCESCERTIPRTLASRFVHSSVKVNAGAAGVENFAGGQRPGGECEAFSELDDIFCRVLVLLNIECNKHLVVLAGIGMGSLDGMTCEVQKAIKNASYLFGAERVLQTAKKLNQRAECYSYYLAKDIVPVLQKIKESSATSSVILFSGDTGFYSGAEKVILELKKLSGIRIEVLPGLSSMQYLFAKAGLSWQNTTVLSLHGVQKEDWVDKLYKIVYNNEQIFFISSSFSDIKELGTELERISSFGKVDFKIILGYQLSYSEEKISVLSPKECDTVYKPGLYSGIIQIQAINTKPL